MIARPCRAFVCTASILLDQFTTKMIRTGLGYRRDPSAAVLFLPAGAGRIEGRMTVPDGVRSGAGCEIAEDSM